MSAPAAGEGDVLGERVLLLAPTVKDAAATRQVLEGVGVACTPCATVDALCAAVEAGGAGAVVLTEPACATREIGAFVDLLRRQPPWSDLPVVVLAQGGATAPAGRRALEMFGNATVLERPVQMASLASVVRTLIRARRRQYQIREHLVERERAAEALRQSERRLRMALTAARMVVWELDPRAGEAVVLENAADVLGLPPDTRLEDTDAGFALVHPDDVERHRALFARSIERCEGHLTEFRVIRRDTGAVIWIEERAHAVCDAPGKAVRLLGVMLDVTKRKEAEAALVESEARFRQLADSIPQLAWMANADGWITWYNRRWHEYTGTTPQQMEGWGWQGVHDPAYLPAVVERWRHSIATGDPFEMEFPLRGADGTFRWFLTRVAPLRGADGTIRMWFGTNTDIEDRRRTAEERARLLEAEREARAEAERVGRVKDEFLATLSHELRTPLNAILGWAQILARPDRSEEDLAEGLRTIERNARAQTQIIEDLLDMSRIVNGKVRLDVQRVDLLPVVEAALETIRPAAEAKGIRVQRVLDPRVGAIGGDPNRLQQVFWNLLSNAVKFTPRGGHVRVVLERVESHVEVSVTDSGEGIRPEFLPHVFDRFRQADPSTTRKYGGLGLGLAIVKQLVELHGGTVRAKSPGPGQGATFVVALPLTAVQPAGPADPPRRQPHVAPDGAEARVPLARLDGLRVLVVDDEADARDLVRRLLVERGATVLTAGSSGEALELFRHRPPDVLVSDIGMPGEDGYSLIGRVRALAGSAGGATPAVALTAYARSEDRTRALRQGFQAHLAKPVEPAELVAVVASLAGRAGVATAPPA